MKSEIRIISTYLEKQYRLSLKQFVKLYRIASHSGILKLQEVLSFLECVTFVNLFLKFKAYWIALDSSSYLTNLTPRTFLRRDIFVQVKSMQFPGLWNAAPGFKVAIWTVLDDYENDVL